MSGTIGIDLGTTTSAAAAVRNGRPRLLTRPAVDSVVSFSGTDETLIGTTAKRRALTQPETTVFGVKRWLGRRFDSRIVQAAAASANTLLEADNGDALVRIDNDVYSPPAVAAEIIMGLRLSAEKALNETVERAVLTVPASFDDAGRRAMMDAGRIAGLDVLGLVNETSAVALTSQVIGTGSGIAALYRLGGGSFEVSIVELGGGTCRVLAVSGDDQLGGDDFDVPIVDALVDGFRAEHGIDLRVDDVAMTRLKAAAQRAKHELSAKAQSEVYLPIISANRGRARHLTHRLTRGWLDPIIDARMEGTRSLCRRALADAGLPANRLDRVFAIGEGTRVPRVRETIRDIFGREPELDLISGETAALGASVRAALTNGASFDTNRRSARPTGTATAARPSSAGSSGGLSVPEIEAARERCTRRRSSDRA